MKYKKKKKYRFNCNKAKITYKTKEEAKENLYAEVLSRRTYEGFVDRIDLIIYICMCAPKFNSR